MSTSHLDRKELKRPDAFMERANEAFRFINENSKAFLGMIALLFALGLGVAFYSNIREQKSEEANSAFFTARKSLAASLEKLPKAAPDWATTAKGDLEKVEKVARDYKGTRASFEAYLLLGDTYLERGDTAKAIEHFKAAADTGRPKAVKAQAHHALAYAYENGKQYDAAIDSLRQVVAAGDKSLKGDALMALGRNYELKGDKPKAMEQYDLVMKEYAGTPLAKAAESQKAQLR